MVPELPDDAVPMEDGFEEDATDVAARRKAEAAAKLEAEMLLRSQVGHSSGGCVYNVCAMCCDVVGAMRQVKVYLWGIAFDSIDSCRESHEDGVTQLEQFGRVCSGGSK